MIEAAPHDAPGNPTHRSRLIVLAGPTAVGKGTVAADDPPADLDAGAREDIEDAAREVGSEQTVTAMAAVEQHALDVCGTPLSR